MRGLREALEKLGEEFEEASRYDTGLSYARVTARIRELLAAHPAEPAVSESVEIPDAAVVDCHAYVVGKEDAGCVNPTHSDCPALVAARPYLMPTREALVEAAHMYYCVKKSEATHPFDQEDYDKADEILEILALLNGES